MPTGWNVRLPKGTNVEISHLDLWTQVRDDPCCEVLLDLERQAPAALSGFRSHANSLTPSPIPSSRTPAPVLTLECDRLPSPGAGAPAARGKRSSSPMFPHPGQSGQGKSVGVTPNAEVNSVCEEIFGKLTRKLSQNHLCGTEITNIADFHY